MDITQGTAVVPDGSRTVEAHGAGSIAIGGNAINSLLVTGDNNTFFVGRYERLVDAYLDPRGLYQELALESFTGRGWLVAAVDSFLARNDRGYLIVEAEAGLGKSTFLAWLARARGYAHHFVRLMPDPQDIGVAIKNLSSQLIRAWDLETYAVGGVLPPTASRPDFLPELLSDVARRRDALRPGEAVVLIVDGLNETVPVASQNPLGLPASLPAGVYVIASQRPVQVPLRLEVPREVITIEADSEENMQDARDYLNRVAESAEIRRRLQAAGVSSQAFVDTLLAKSRGVWIYLHYVIPEIARGSRSPKDVDQLPTGLWQYYAQYWREWQRSHAERWPELDLPLLSLIGAAAEPLSAQLLTELAGVRRTTTIETLLEDDWRPFIQVEETDEEIRYQAFHDSLKEFLHGEVSSGQLTTAERSFARRLARATNEAHSLIADRYLSAWGGLAERLRALREGDAVGMDDGYGRRHIVEHLDKAGRLEDLHTLMTLSWTEGERHSNAWFTVHRRTGELSSYRRDLSTTWNAVRRGADAHRCTLQLRYALVVCSLNSLDATTPPVLWSTLVSNGLLTPEEALTHVRQIPTAEERAEALTSLIEVAPDRLRGMVEREALAAVRTVPDGYWRVGELWRLNPHIAPELRGELLAIVRSLADPYYQVVAYRLLGVEEGLPSLTAIRSGAGFEADLESPSGLAGSAEFVEAYLRRRRFAATLLRQAGLGTIEEAGQAPDDPMERYWRAHLLVLGAREASGADERRLATAAMETGEQIGDRRDVMTAWGMLGTALSSSATLDDEALLGLSLRIVDPIQRAVLLISAAAGQAAGGPETDRLAMEALGQVGSDQARASVLMAAAPALARRDVQGIRRLASLVGAAVGRAEVLLTVAPLTSAAAAERLCGDVLALLEATVGLAGRAGILSRAAAYLPAASLSTAQEVVATLDDPEVRAAVNSAIGARYCELGQIEQATALLPSVSGFWRAFLGRALAQAHARSGDPRQALSLADRLPYAPWRVEILAIAAHRLSPSVSDAAMDDIAAIAAALEPSSGVSVLARAAAAAPTRYQPALTAAARAAGQGIQEPYERAVALRTVAETLVATGDGAGALAVAEEIQVDGLRADALLAVLTSADSADGDSAGRAAEQAGALNDPRARIRVRAQGLHIAMGAVDAHGRQEAATRNALSADFDAAMGEFATRPRGELLERLPDLLPVAASLDGPHAIATVVADLADIVSWWP